MTRTSLTQRAAAAAAMIALGACTKSDKPAADSAATAAAPAPATSTPVSAANVVNFTAKDFSFEGPDSIPAGLTRFHLTSAGQELHHLALIKLDQGKTFADFQAAVKNPGPPPSWAIDYGGVNPSVPGGQVSAMEVVEPGNYAVVCFVESAGHVPHFTKGMMRPLTVTANPSGIMTEPNADVTLTLNDYSFTLSKPLVAGKQLIKVENAAAQPHEVVLVQLAPGKTIEDVGNWVMDMKGPPPGKPIGGIPGFMKGKNTFFEADLEPGDYGMICFLPDAKDGKPHFTHGMTQQFKVS